MATRALTCCSVPLSLRIFSVTPTMLHALEASPDFDGLKNLFEFFLNDIPKTASVSRLPVVARESTDLTLTYTRLKAARRKASSM